MGNSAVEDLLGMYREFSQPIAGIVPKTREIADASLRQVEGALQSREMASPLSRYPHPGTEPPQDYPWYDRAADVVSGLAGYALSPMGGWYESVVVDPYASAAAKHLGVDEGAARGTIHALGIAIPLLGGLSRAFGMIRFDPTSLSDMMQLRSLAGANPGKYWQYLVCRGRCRMRQGWWAGMVVLVSGQMLQMSILLAGPVLSIYGLARVEIARGRVFM